MLKREEKIRSSDFLSRKRASNSMADGDTHRVSTQKYAITINIDAPLSSPSACHTKPALFPCIKAEKRFDDSSTSSWRKTRNLHRLTAIAQPLTSKFMLCCFKSP
ncbi:hypothetical protein Peur_065098 [Populus x canadensis]